MTPKAIEPDPTIDSEVDKILLADIKAFFASYERHSYEHPEMPFVIDDYKHTRAKTAIKNLIAQEANKAQTSFRDLTAERLALKLTQADMAAVIGVSRLTYIKWERNMSLMPIGRYKQICLELDRFKALTADKEQNLV